MKIGIDAHMVGHQATGNYTYVVNVIQALVQLNGASHHYTIYVNQPELVTSLSLRSGRTDVRLLRPPSSLARILFSLPIEIWRRPVDVVHMQYIMPPVLPRCATVLTVHDISFEHFPEFFTRRDLLRTRRLVRPSALRADIVIAVSEYTKQDLVKTYGIDSERIVVTPLAPGPLLRPPEDSAETERVCRGYGIDGPYFLYVGDIQPRKNVRRLIQAYARLMAAGDIRHRLVIVGRKAYLYSDVFEEARRSGLGDQIVFTDFVPQDHLPHLYAGADAFVFPSLFEGFGRPVLEAMACGAAVITSRSSSLPEVAGAAALYVDPYSVDEIARALRRVAHDGELRTRLSAAGREQAVRFSWEQTARRTLDAYEAAYEAGRRRRAKVGA